MAVASTHGIRPYGALGTAGSETSALEMKIEELKQRFARAVGERAARLRKERGITQKEMAEIPRASQPHISFIENGETRLHGVMLAKIARVLDVSADDLLGRKVKRPAAGTFLPRAGMLYRVLAKQTALPERDQRAIVRLISSLVAASHQRHGE